MLHPGEVGPSEELLRLKAIVETLESKSQEAIREVEDWKARFQAMRQSKVNLDGELAHSVEAFKRLEKQLQGMVPARSLVLHC
jgi:hypothetical protein